jgi:hypothetical protein
MWRKNGITEHRGYDKLFGCPVLIALSSCSFTSSLDDILCPERDPECALANASGGNGGTGGDVDAKTGGAAGAVQPPLRLFYQNGEPALQAQHIRPYFQIQNTGSTDQPLNELSIRYYYTIETGAAQVYACTSFVGGDCAMLTGNFERLEGTGVTHYLELGFTPESGHIPPHGARTGDIKVVIRNQPSADYDQSDDYSFTLQAELAFIEWQNVTLYRGGVLVAGTEPL